MLKLHKEHQSNSGNQKRRDIFLNLVQNSKEVRKESRQLAAGTTDCSDSKMERIGSPQSTLILDSAKHLVKTSFASTVSPGPDDKSFQGFTAMIASQNNHTNNHQPAI